MGDTFSDTWGILRDGRYLEISGQYSVVYGGKLRRQHSRDTWDTGNTRFQE